MKKTENQTELEPIDNKILTNEDWHIMVSRVMFPHKPALALAWLKGEGFDMVRSTYYDKIKKLDADAIHRLNNIAIDFPVFIHEFIMRFEMYHSLMMECYHKEPEYYKKAQIVRMMADLEPIRGNLIVEIKNICENNGVKIQPRSDVLRKSGEAYDTKPVSL